MTTPAWKKQVALMIKKGAKELRVDLIEPNRLNANVMGVDLMSDLETDMAALDYNPITVSPMLIFYKDHPEVITIPLEEARERYVICDGEHRWLSNKNAGLETIWCLIEYWIEKDAMAHFYKRQRIKGELDPLKEAVLFQHEIRVNGRTRKWVIEEYNVPSMKYLKTRLAILKLTDAVVGLFYTQEEYPGILSISHLENLSRLPPNDQYMVAEMSLERNWTRDLLIDEIRRIKEGRGTRLSHATVEAPEEIPPSRPTQAQRGLHRNIDMLLSWWQEAMIRRVKEAGDDGIARSILVSEAPVSKGTVAKLLKAMVEMKVLDRFEMSREGRRGRSPSGYRIHVVEGEDEEPVKVELKKDEEIFKGYPEKEGPPDVIETPESWTGPKPEVEEAIQVEELPTIVTKDILSSFLDKVFKLAMTEGFDLKATEEIDGRDPDQWLIDELSEDLDSFIIEPDLRALRVIALRACQLHYRLGERQ